MSTAARAQAAGHKRKISFAELTDTFRRAGPLVAPPPHQQHPPQPTQAEIQRQHLERTRQQDLARRQSKKPTDRDIPDELGEVVVGDGLERYKQLRDAERKLDAVMMRKRLDVTDNLQRRFTRRQAVLRVWVSNTAEGQPWQAMEEGSVGLGEDGTFDFGENSQATFRVKIEGRLLEDPEEKKQDGEEKKAKRVRLSNLFKAITIDFDRNPALQPDGYSQIEWRKPDTTQNTDPNSSEANFDTLEFERKADENINVTISMYRDEKSERFKLSPPLAEILDAEEEDRAGAVQGIWEYCRAMGLQEDEDKRNIVCDDALRKLFNKETLYFPQVPDLIQPHLLPLPPIKLPYTIRVDKDYINDPTTPSKPTIYDLRVSLPSPMSAMFLDFHRNKTHIPELKSIIETDDDLALLVQKLHNTNAKRKFFENLAKDPANFLKRWTSSQQRDLEIILAEQTRGGGDDAAGEEFRKGGRGGVWGSENARESVGLWLAKGQKAH